MWHGKSIGPDSSDFHSPTTTSSREKQVTASTRGQEVEEKRQETETDRERQAERGLLHGTWDRDTLFAYQGKGRSNQHFTTGEQQQIRRTKKVACGRCVSAAAAGCVDLLLLFFSPFGLRFAVCVCSGVWRCVALACSVLLVAAGFCCEFRDAF